MRKKKLLVLIAGGVSLRNFVYSDFHQEAKKLNMEIVFWNNTPLDLHTFGFEQIKLHGAKIHFFTELLKEARKDIELKLNVKEFNDDIHEKYKFKRNNRTVNSFIKNIFIKLIIIFYSHL